MNRTLHSLAFLVIAALLVKPCLTLISASHDTRPTTAIVRLVTHKLPNRCSQPCIVPHATEPRRKDLKSAIAQDSPAVFVAGRDGLLTADFAGTGSMPNCSALDLRGRDLLNLYCRLLI